MFTLTIETGNAAFSEHPEDEIATQLRRLADFIEDGFRLVPEHDGGTILDSNGNNVGRWTYAPARTD